MKYIAFVVYYQIESGGGDASRRQFRAPIVFGTDEKILFIRYGVVDGLRPSRPPRQLSTQEPLIQAISNARDNTVSPSDSYPPASNS